MYDRYNIIIFSVPIYIYIYTYIKKLSVFLEHSISLMTFRQNELFPPRNTEKNDIII